MRATEVRILQPHYYYFAVLGCDSAVLGLSACHFSPNSDPMVSNSDVLLPVSLLTHSLFHTWTSAAMAGHQTRSKTRSGDQPAEATPKAASTSKRKQTSGSSSKTKPDSSGKGAKHAKKKDKMQTLFLLRRSRRFWQRKCRGHQLARSPPLPESSTSRRKILRQSRGKTVRALSFCLGRTDSLICTQ